MTSFYAKEAMQNSFLKDFTEKLRLELDKLDKPRSEVTLQEMGEAVHAVLPKEVYVTITIDDVLNLFEVADWL